MATNQSQIDKEFREFLGDRVQTRELLDQFMREREQKHEQIEQAKKGVACSQAKYLEGPSAYNRCLVHQLELLKNSPH